MFKGVYDVGLYAECVCLPGGSSLCCGVYLVAQLLEF